MLRDCTHRRENPQRLHNLEELDTMEDIVKETPQIYVALDKCQANHQGVVVEVEGKIIMQSIYVFIDPGSTHSYITPKVVEGYSLIKM